MTRPKMPPGTGTAILKGLWNVIRRKTSSSSTTPRQQPLPYDGRPLGQGEASPFPTRPQPQRFESDDEY